MTSTPLHPQPLVARTPEDVLAVVPVLLGFEPHDSVVMLTSGGSESFHARIDLPPRDHPEEAVGELLEPARQHRVSSVVLVLYSGERQRADEVGHRLAAAFADADIHVVETLRADGERWYAAGLPETAVDGVPYDVVCHPFRVQAVLDGRVLHRSREELVALLDAVPTEVATTRRALRRAVPAGSETVALLVGHRAGTGRFLTDELAVVLLGLQDLGVRDAAWAELRRATAEQHVVLWTDAVQRSPVDLVDGPASVLALAAWLAGHGALAWCAVDRSQSADPTNSLARLVSDLLRGAVPPSMWDASLFPP